MCNRDTRWKSFAKFIYIPNKNDWNWHTHIHPQSYIIKRAFTYWNQRNILNKQQQQQEKKWKRIKISSSNKNEQFIIIIELNSFEFYATLHLNWNENLNNQFCIMFYYFISWITYFILFRALFNAKEGWYDIVKGRSPKSRWSQLRFSNRNSHNK